jgi:2-keto-3-deoxy-L-rhamnonate aldolase RhmA
VKSAAVSGQKIRGVHLTFPSTPLIEAIARFGVDFIYLDCEHGCFDGHDVEIACVAAERFGVTPIARIPDPSPATISRFLDRGIKGIVVPHINSIDEARAVISAAYFSPLGQRSYGGIRGYAMHKDMTQFFADCNKTTSVSIMIETKGALEAAHEIAALEGVDYMSFGMVDLSQALGHPGDLKHAELQAAVVECSQRVHAAGKPIREDFINFAWIHQILSAGAEQLLGANPHQ